MKNVSKIGKCSKYVKKYTLKTQNVEKMKIKASFLNYLMYESNCVLGKHCPSDHQLKNEFRVKIRDLVITIDRISKRDFALSLSGFNFNFNYFSLLLVIIIWCLFLFFVVFRFKMLEKIKITRYNYIIIIIILISLRGLYSRDALRMRIGICCGRGCRGKSVCRCGRPRRIGPIAGGRSDCTVHTTVRGRVSCRPRPPAADPRACRAAVARTRSPNSVSVWRPRCPQHYILYTHYCTCNIIIIIKLQLRTF